jgi:hypothetical protein
MGSVYGLVSVLIVGLPIGLWFGPDMGLAYGLSVGLIIGLPIGLIVGIREYGGNTVIQHYILRLWLSRQGILPFPFRDSRLVAYLDAMADRILLRRVGGGWVFIHRYLLEYFASLEPDSQNGE